MNTCMVQKQLTKAIAQHGMRKVVAIWATQGGREQV